MRPPGGSEAAAGIYSISARAGGDSGYSVMTLSRDVVESVQLSPGGRSLGLELENLGVRSLDDVRRIS